MIGTPFRSWRILIICGMLVWAVGCEADDAPVDRSDTWADVEAAGEGAVTVLYVPAEGFAYEDADGELTGLTVEILRLFADWMRETHDVDLTLNFVEEPDWRTFYERVQAGAGGVFGLGNVTITEERRAELQFSPPYMTNIAVLISHEEVPELEAWDDWAATFDGRTLLAFEGTLHEERLRDIQASYAPDAELAFTDSNDDILDRVADGGYVAYIDGYNYWRAVEGGAPLKRHPIGDDPAEEFGIIMPLESDWDAPVAEFFEEGDGLLARDAYRDLMEEHLGERVVEALDEVQ